MGWCFLGENKEEKGVAENGNAPPLTPPTAREYSAHVHGAMGTPVRTSFNNLMQQFRFSFFGFAWFFTDPGRRSAS